MAIGKLRQVFVVAADFEAQVAFYRDVLGLTLKFRDGVEWAQFEGTGAQLALAGPREALGAPPGSQVPVFEASGLDDVLGAVRAGGGSHGLVRDMGAHGKTVLCRDPAGSVFALLEK